VSKTRKQTPRNRVWRDHGDDHPVKPRKEPAMAFSFDPDEAYDENDDCPSKFDEDTWPNKFRDP